MKHIAFRVFVLFAVITAFSVIPAFATVLGTVNIQNHGNPYSDQAQLFGGGLTGGTYYTGIYSWTNEGGTGAGIDVPNWGFCIELTQDARNGWQDVLPLPEVPLPALPIYGTPMGETKANYIRELWGRNFNPAWITGADRQFAEAFNACMWEIIYETEEDIPPEPSSNSMGIIWDVTSGASFHVTGVEQWATANLWLSQLNGDTAYFANNLVATDDGQDYIVQTPEPAALLLLAAGAAAVLRKRNKK